MTESYNAWRNSFIFIPIIAFRSVTESYNNPWPDDTRILIIAFRSVTESYNLLSYRFASSLIIAFRSVTESYNYIYDALRHIEIIAFRSVTKSHNSLKLYTNWFTSLPFHGEAHWKQQSPDDGWNTLRWVLRKPGLDSPFASRAGSTCCSNLSIYVYGKL